MEELLSKNKVSVSLRTTAVLSTKKENKVLDPFLDGFLLSLLLTCSQYRLRNHFSPLLSDTLGRKLADSES